MTLGGVRPERVGEEPPPGAAALLRRKGTTDAVLPDPVQLHPSHVGQAHRQPEDRRTAAAQYVEAVGGTLHGFWYAFGAHDAYALYEAPDNVAIAAMALAINSGALSAYETIPLLTVEETLAALETAATITYRPPGTAG